MTDKARKLLRRILTHLEWTDEAGANEPLEEEIRTYLAESEVLSIEEAHRYYSESYYDKTGWVFFIRGIRFAEKHHGIGGGDE